MGILWETSFWVFFILTVIISSGVAAAAGRALALQWTPYWQVVFYIALLGLADRFLHWGLFLDAPLDVYKGDILSLHYYLVNTIILLIVASIAYRVTWAGQMVRQYKWLYKRTGPFTWAERQD